MPKAFLLELVDMPLAMPKCSGREAGRGKCQLLSLGGGGLIQWAGVSLPQPRTCTRGTADDEVMKTLARRAECNSTDVLHQLLALEGVQDCLEASEKQDLQSMREEGEKTASTSREFWAELRAMKAKRNPSQPSSSSQAACKTAASKKRYPKECPPIDGGFSLDMMNPLLPPGVMACQEAFHGRWRLYWKGPPAKSRSATYELYGYGGAARRLLREVWLDHEEVPGTPCPFAGL